MPISQEMKNPNYVLTTIPTQNYFPDSITYQTAPFLVNCQNSYPKKKNKLNCSNRNNLKIEALNRKFQTQKIFGLQRKTQRRKVGSERSYPEETAGELTDKYRRRAEIQFWCEREKRPYRKISRCSNFNF